MNLPACGHPPRFLGILPFILITSPHILLKISIFFPFARSFIVAGSFSGIPPIPLFCAAMLTCFFIPVEPQSCTVLVIGFFPWAFCGVCIWRPCPPPRGLEVFPFLFFLHYLVVSSWSFPLQTDPFLWWGVVLLHRLVVFRFAERLFAAQES